MIFWQCCSFLPSFAYNGRAKLEIFHLIFKIEKKIILISILISHSDTLFFWFHDQKALLIHRWMLSVEKWDRSTHEKQQI